MTVLTREMFQQLKNQNDFLKKEYVEIFDDFGVYVTELLAGQMIELSEDIQEAGAKETSLLWVTSCCVDENMERVFSKEDVLAMPKGVFDKLFTAIASVNGFIGDGVEEAEKNLEVADS